MSLLTAVVVCENAMAATGPMGAIELEISEMSPSGKIVATLRNRSMQPLRVWKEGNSWGAAHWRVLRIRNKSVELFYQNPDQGFTRNFPNFEEIPPRAERQRTLDLNSTLWLGPNARPVNLQSGDEVIVIYDVPKTYPWAGAPITEQAAGLRVWYGVVSAAGTVP